MKLRIILILCFLLGISSAETVNMKTAIDYFNEGVDFRNAGLNEEAVEKFK